MSQATPERCANFKIKHHGLRSAWLVAYWSGRYGHYVICRMGRCKLQLVNDRRFVFLDIRKSANLGIDKEIVVGVVKSPNEFRSIEALRVVAGVGFEPTTFRL